MILTLLGLAPAATAAVQLRAMAAIAGPPLSLTACGEIAAIAQTARPGPAARAARSLEAQLRSPKARADLLCLQRRLEQACLNGPFLPADPAGARATPESLRSALEQEAASLTDALGAQGNLVQWDVVLTWPADSVLGERKETIRALAEARARGDAGCPAAADRDALAGAVADTLAEIRAVRTAALRAVLAPVCRALIPLNAGECAAALTVLLPNGEEARIEAALATLPDADTHNVAADLKGPLPPLAFTPVRLAASSAETVRQAWARFGLRGESDAAALRTAWRRMVPGLHPDHGAADGEALQQAGAAYRLLRGLMPRAGAATLRQAQDKAALRLLVTPLEHAP